MRGSEAVESAPQELAGLPACAAPGGCGAWPVGILVGKRWSHEVGSEQTFLMDNAARREGGLYGSLEAWAKALVVGEHFL